MKKNTFYLLFLICLQVNAQSVIGKWKTLDDDTGKAKSIVEIYEKSGKIYGKIIKIFDVEKVKKLCTECSGEDKNKPILGMVIIKGLTKDGAEYSSGKILDPQNGKLYKCYITLEGIDKLKIRGYVGIAMLGRTQYWSRLK
jgi:uncharacterized protein (DUF2147 family)